MIKKKKELIQKAKVKKSYAKTKAHDPAPPAPEVAAPESSTVVVKAPAEPLHPDRQAMLNEPEPEEPAHPVGKKPRAQKPRYFEKEKAIAEAKKKEAEARRAEFEQREAERKKKLAERERHRKAMAKARTGGKNGQRKLGRESQVLLEKVQRMVK